MVARPDWVTASRSCRRSCQGDGIDHLSLQPLRGWGDTVLSFSISGESGSLKVDESCPGNVAPDGRESNIRGTRTARSGICRYRREIAEQHRLHERRRRRTGLFLGIVSRAAHNQYLPEPFGERSRLENMPDIRTADHARSL